MSKRKPRERTLEDFASDLLSRGRTLNEISAICYSTKWRESVKEVIQIAKQIIKSR